VVKGKKDEKNPNAVTFFNHFFTRSLRHAAIPLQISNRRRGNQLEQNWGRAAPTS